LDISCEGSKKEIETAIAKAIYGVEGCLSSLCGGGGKAGSRNVTRQWIFALATGRYFCPDIDAPVDIPVGKHHRLTVAVISDPNNPDVGLLQTAYGGSAGGRTLVLGKGENLYDRKTAIAPRESPKGCLARTLAHEALHGVMDTIPRSRALPQFYSHPLEYLPEYILEPMQLIAEGGSAYSLGSHYNDVEAAVEKEASDCVDCK
jgi:hypothetical protein